MGSVYGKHDRKVFLVKDLKIDKVFCKFSPTEITAIRTVWNKALERNVILELLVEVIVQRPEFGKLFGTTCTTASELRASVQCQTYASKISGFIDLLIGALDEITVLDIREKLFNVGVMHFHKKVDFDAANYLLFKRTLMEKICEGVDELTSAAWFKLLGLMIKEMKNGYLSEALRNGQTSEEINVLTNYVNV